MMKPLKSLADLPAPRSRLEACADFARRIRELSAERSNIECRYDTMTPAGRRRIADLNRQADRCDDWIATIIDGTPITLGDVLAAADQHPILFDEAEAPLRAAPSKGRAA